MITLTRLTTAGVLTAFLSVTPAMAQFAWEEEGWDTDGDGVFSVDEFREGFRERINFAEWDSDADGMLSEEEFGGGIFTRYDADLTDGIEEAEFGALDEDFGDGAVWRYRGDELVEAPGEEIAGEGLVEEGIVEESVVGDALDEVTEVADTEAWDIDGDGVVLRNEFQDGFREWGTFGEFDVNADGGVTEDELTEGIFTRYDADGTGFIEEPELTDIGDDMGDEGFWDL